MNNIVSIITPSYNSSKFIDDCVNSVINQTYLDWEMLIVDDKSSDDSRDKILHLSKKDSRIKYFFHKITERFIIFYIVTYFFPRY